MSIKFNLWDIEREQYFRDVLSLEKDKINKWGTLEIRTSKNVKWLQFTGLKDKNGIDIYEGDIFHCNKVNYVLRFLKLGGAYTVHKIGDETDERFLFHCNEQLEVIGNIYQNPELLPTN